jgi:flavin-dependent dehydrogenase
MKYIKTRPEKQVDVVGAGPVGVLTAIKLTLGSVLVLERPATGWQRTESS